MADMERLNLKCNDVTYVVDVDTETSQRLKTDTVFASQYVLLLQNEIKLQNEVQKQANMNINEVSNQQQKEDLVECEPNTINNEDVFSWTPKKTKLLISLRADMDSEFQKPKSKKSKLWDKISGNFKDICGHNLDGEDHNERSGQDTASWKFFTDMDAILGEKIVNNPPKEVLKSIFHAGTSSDNTIHLDKEMNITQTTEQLWMKRKLKKKTKRSTLMV